jgi:hypothetical protein
MRTLEAITHPRKEGRETMVKRSMVIGILCLSLMALLQPQAMAGISFKSAGNPWSWSNPYTIQYVLVGNENTDYHNFVASEIQLLEACLVCENNGQFDVRGGLGGTTILTYSATTEAEKDEAGRVTLTQTLCATVDPGNSCTLEDFRALWGGGEPLDCRNRNWTEYQFLATSLILTGEVYTDCMDPEDIPGSCDLSAVDTISFYCETDEGCRTEWPGIDGEVRYICVPEGSPIAWDENFRVRVDRTLNVKAPGVLDNDSDAEGNPLTASLVTDVSNGTLSLLGDGSFTYTPNTGWSGVDTFTYIANDGVNDSNEATVTITVYEH